MSDLKLQLIIEALNKTDTAFGELRNDINAVQNRLSGAGQAGKKAGDQTGAAFDKAGKHAHGATQKVGLFNNGLMNASMQLMMLQMVAQQVFGAVAFLIRNTYGEVEKFTMSVTQMAAMITSFQQDSDVGASYRKATEYAQGLVGVLEEIDAQTVASAGDLQLITEEMVKQRVLLDTNNQAAVEGFKNIANAAAIISSGYQNKEIQLRQEIRSLMQGTVDMNSQLAQQVDAMVGGGLKQKVELWKEEGVLIEKLGGLLTGYAAAAGDIEKTWNAIGSTLETIKSKTMRLGFTEMYRDTNEQLLAMNAYLKEHTNEIGSGLRQGWLAVEGLVEATLVLLSPFKYLLVDAAVVIGVIVEGLGLVAAVALPTITEKLVLMVDLLRDVVHLGYVFGAFFVDSIGVALESMGNIGRILYNIITMNKEGLQAAISDFNNMDSVARLKDDAVILKGILESTKENTADLFNLEGFDQRYAEYTRKIAGAKKDIETPELPGKQKKFEKDPDKVKKTLSGLALDVEKLGLNKFDAKIADINAKATELRKKFGDLAEIEVWRKAQVGAVETSKNMAVLKGELKELETSTDNALGAFQTFTGGLNLTDDAMDKITSGLTLYDAKLDDLGDTTGKVIAAADELGWSFSSAFEDAIIGGKGLRDVVQGLIQDIAKLVIRQTVTTPLAGAISTGISGMFNPTSTYNAATNAGTSAPINYGNYTLGTPKLEFHEGGMFVPKFHAGGLNADEGYAVLKGGERVLTGEQNRTFDKLAALLTGGGGSSGGDVSITQNLDLRGADQSAVPQLAAAAKQIADNAVQQVRQSMRRGGEFYNLTRG